MQTTKPSIFGGPGKIRPLGFERAATVAMMGLSQEAATNLTRVIQVAAKEKPHDDSAAIKIVRSALRRAAKGRKSRAWATEVLQFLPGAVA